MNAQEKEQLARRVEAAYFEFVDALSERAFPQAAFRALFEAVVPYFEATLNDELLHRCVISHVNELREFIQVSKKRIPGGILHDAEAKTGHFNKSLR